MCLTSEIHNLPHAVASPSGHSVLFGRRVDAQSVKKVGSGGEADVDVEGSEDGKNAELSSFELETGCNPKKDRKQGSKGICCCVGSE